MDIISRLVSSGGCFDTSTTSVLTCIPDIRYTSLAGTGHSKHHFCVHLHILILSLSQSQLASFI